MRRGKTFCWRPGSESDLREKSPDCFFFSERGPRLKPYVCGLQTPDPSDTWFHVSPKKNRTCTDSKIRILLARSHHEGLCRNRTCTDSKLQVLLTCGPQAKPDVYGLQTPDLSDMWLSQWNRMCMYEFKNSGSCSLMAVDLHDLK